MANSRTPTPTSKSTYYAFGAFQKSTTNCRFSTAPELVSSRCYYVYILFAHHFVIPRPVFFLIYMPGNARIQVNEYNIHNSSNNTTTHTKQQKPKNQVLLNKNNTKTQTQRNNRVPCLKTISSLYCFPFSF